MLVTFLIVETNYLIRSYLREEWFILAYGLSRNSPAWQEMSDSWNSGRVHIFKVQKMESILAEAIARLYPMRPPSKSTISSIYRASLAENQKFKHKRLVGNILYSNDSA